MIRFSSGSFRSRSRSRSPRLTISGGTEDTPLFEHEVEQREYEWIIAERARDEAEGDRQALFSAALEAMRRNITMTSPHSRPALVTVRPDGDSDSEASRPRSPFPPTGFAPQALLKRPRIFPPLRTTTNEGIRNTPPSLKRAS